MTKTDSEADPRDLVPQESPINLEDRSDGEEESRREEGGHRAKIPFADTIETEGVRFSANEPALTQRDNRQSKVKIILNPIPPITQNRTPKRKRGRPKKSTNEEGKTTMATFSSTGSFSSSKHCVQSSLKQLSFKTAQTF